MKKVFIFLVGMIIATSMAYSQGSLAKGSSQLNAGIGFSSYTTPIYVGLDYAIHKDMTVGGEISYRNRTNYWRIIGITGNWNYHFNSLLKLPKEWDVYAGLKLGYLYYSTYDGYSDGSTPLLAGGQIGSRWFFSNNFGVNVELGVGNSFSDGRIGITYKF